MTTLTGTAQSPVDGVQLSTVLIVSTRHMPDVGDDLGRFNWGVDADIGLIWMYAYEERPAEDFPDWMLNICITARDKYNANWIVLDPAGDVFDDWPTYDS